MLGGELSAASAVVSHSSDMAAFYPSSGVSLDGYGQIQFGTVHLCAQVRTRLPEIRRHDVLQYFGT